MSKYTSEVRYICENYAGLTESVGYNSTQNVIRNSREKIFDFLYPIFDESYRSVLETKILKHFYTREIGAESVGLWKLWLDTRMNEIMPYYNQLYLSELIEFNPLYDVDITTDHTKTNNGTEKRDGEFSETSKNTGNNTVNKNGSSSGSGSTEGTNKSKQTGGNKIDRWEYFSDTPQGGVNGLATLNYLTNAKHITDDGSSTIIDNDNETFNESSYSETNNSKETGERTENENKNGTNKNNAILNNTEEYLEHVKGKTAGTSYSKRLEEYRQTFLNIDMQVINELNDLFMNLW